MLTFDEGISDGGAIGGVSLPDTRRSDRMSAVSDGYRKQTTLRTVTPESAVPQRDDPFETTVRHSRGSFEGSCDSDEELTGVYNVGTGEAYSFNGMVAMINDALGADVKPTYVECPFDGSVHDILADYSNFHETTGWEPEIDFREGVERVCAPSREADAPGTNEAGRDRERRRGRPGSRDGTHRIETDRIGGIVL